MRILSYQPFSLFTNGGGSRILRRLYEGHENEITSLVIESYYLHIQKGNIEEITVPALPQMKKWHRWYYRDVVKWFRTRLFKTRTIENIRKTARTIHYDVLHVIDHGIFADALCIDEFIYGKKIWASFHDHFSTMGGTFQNTHLLWNISDRRFVISSALGREYSSLFGDKDYEIITDGLKEDELSEPSIVTENVPISIYFSGLLHIDYYPLFQVLAEALDILSSQGNQFKIILRGTQKLSFLEKRNFLVEYLPFTLDNEVLKGELDNAAILYLPIKFTVSDFYQFSLSTKMVGYLGGAGVILYHGPSESAACLMLEEYNAAITCTVNDRDRMVDALKAALSTESVSISQHAKKLARQQFLIDNIQTRFWQNESVVIV